MARRAAASALPRRIANAEPVLTLIRGDLGDERHALGHDLQQVTIERVDHGAAAQHPRAQLGPLRVRRVEPELPGLARAPRREARGHVGAEPVKLQRHREHLAPHGRAVVEHVARHHGAEERRVGLPP